MSRAAALQRILNDIQTLTLDELQEKYGIEVDQDETVFDPIEHKEFDSLRNWAEFAAQLEEEEFSHFEKIGSKQRFDDEY